MTGLGFKSKAPGCKTHGFSPPPSFPLRWPPKTQKESTVLWNFRARTVWLRAYHNPRRERTSQGRVSSFPGQKTAELSCSLCQGADGAFSLLKHVLLEEMRCVFLQELQGTLGSETEGCCVNFIYTILKNLLRKLTCPLFTAGLSVQGKRAGTCPIPHMVMQSTEGFGGLPAFWSL